MSRMPQTWKPRFTLINFFYGVWRPGMLVSYAKQEQDQYMNTEHARWKIVYYPGFSRLITVAQGVIWLGIILLSLVWRLCMLARVLCFKKPSKRLAAQMEATRKYFTCPAWSGL